MKVETEEQKAEFKPVSITFTMETEDDLRALWHIFNIPDSFILGTVESTRVPTRPSVYRPRDVNMYGLWAPVDALAKQAGLRK